VDRCGQLITIPNKITPYTILEVEGVILCSFFKENDFIDIEKRYGIKEITVMTWEESNNARQLVSYFEEEKQKLKLQVAITNGTAFQQKVWSAMRSISYGETWSYGQVARAVGTRAYRAVGQACKNNPLPIVVPCHRVIASDGSIGGFFGDIELKRKLLAHENYII
jgi:methylated-DNA-[protein]-cysteine S-methyltransferase